MLFQVNKFILSNLLIILVLSLALFSCNDEDDPVAPQEEHFEAVGTVIYDASGKEIVRIFRAETTDTLFAEAGLLSDHHTVKFLDEDEEILDPPSEEHQTMSGEIADTDIAQFWQHEGEEGGFEFHIDAKNPGVTTLEIFINHEGHRDYRSGLIPVAVR